MSNPTKRQAVLLIHGIGEQRPMSTLRSFVAALVGGDYRSKPDDLLKDFELRRLTYENKKPNVTYQTCFFECYWAYRLRDTNYKNILEWGWRLLTTPPENVPSRLKRYQLLCWITLVLVALALILTIIYQLIIAINLAEGLDKIVQLYSWIGGCVTLIALFSSGVVLYRIGDAARYLDSLPGNIMERQAIRALGIKLLRKLHEVKDKDSEKPKYDRIIIIGHSLGSVIGYDILKFYWADVNEYLKIECDAEAEKCLKELKERVDDLNKSKKGEDADPDPEAVRKYQDAQSTLMTKLPQTKWRITDFITLGSPLTHADFLLATSKKDLESQQSQRELPTCPPQEDSITYPYAYPDEDEEYYILHHAAHFAVTKWTNLYYPDDLIGGPVSRLFGAGIRDIRCNFIKNSLFDQSHTQYWPSDPSSPSEGLNKLKEVVPTYWG